MCQLHKYFIDDECDFLVHVPNDVLRRFGKRFASPRRIDKNRSETLNGLFSRLTILSLLASRDQKTRLESVTL